MICRIKTDAFAVGGDALQRKGASWLDYELKLEALYEVYGIGIFHGETQALLDPSDDGRPVWYDLDGFEIINPRIPSTWEVHSGKLSDWSVIISYRLLGISEQHFNGLLERKKEDLEIFRSAKRAMLELP